MGPGNDNGGDFNDLTGPGRVRRHDPASANRTVRQTGPQYHIHEDFSCKCSWFGSLTLLLSVFLSFSFVSKSCFCFPRFYALSRCTV